MMSYLMGSKVDWVSVTKAWSLKGHCHLSTPDSPNASALIAAAGMAAELEHYGHFNEQGAKYDTKTLDGIVGDDDHARLHTIHLARLALTEGKTWVIVDSVARVLMRDGAVRGEYVHKVAKILEVPVMPQSRARSVPRKRSVPAVLFYPRPLQGHIPSELEVKRLRRTPGHWLYGGEIYA